MEGFQRNLQTNGHLATIAKSHQIAIQNDTKYLILFPYLLIILGCLEECLKYVLLLNFDEEPKYDYLIEELKKAYTYSIMETGEKPNPNAFK